MNTAALKYSETVMFWYYSPSRVHFVTGFYSKHIDSKII